MLDLAVSFFIAILLEDVVETERHADTHAFYAAIGKLLGCDMQLAYIRWCFYARVIEREKSWDRNDVF